MAKKTFYWSDSYAQILGFGLCCTVKCHEHGWCFFKNLIKILILYNISLQNWSPSKEKLYRSTTHRSNCLNQLPLILWNPADAYLRPLTGQCGAFERNAHSVVCYLNKVTRWKERWGGISHLFWRTNGVVLNKAIHPYKPIALDTYNCLGLHCK